MVYFISIFSKAKIYNFIILREFHEIEFVRLSVRYTIWQI